MAPASAKQSNESSIRVAETSAPENLEGERKTVTALFADIKGSTELEQDLDPEEARAIIDPALKLMIDAVRRYDGYIVQSTGDGIFALFGAPVAHEDHPQRALYAALRMQDDLKQYSARLREAGNLPLEARVGVNTGEVVVRSITTGEGHTEYTPIGHTTNLASRMQALAPTGSIAISEATRKFVEGYFALRSLGPTKVKGVSEPVNVYEVTGLGPLRTRLQRSAGRGFSKFVGRQPEIEAIARAAELAKSGRGQIVAAVALPGVGKSRLYYEFKVRNQVGFTVLEARSVSHGKASPYAPVIALLSGYFDFDEGDDARRRREKVIGRIVALDRALEDTIPYLFALLDIADSADPVTQLDGQVRSRRALEAIKRILIREARNQPLMLIFEDLHEIDEGTQALLNLLIDSIGAARILLLVNYRPEYRHEWGNRASYTQLRLEPLGRESAAEMLSAILGDAPEVAPLKAQIVEKTGGTPFFIEETIQSLLEDGTLVRNGQIKVARAAGDLRVPPTVQALLAARIDRLSASEKQLLQTLAVIGNRFSIGLVARVEGRAEDVLLPVLANLQEREFIFEDFDAGEIEYRFKHALTHDVAYESLLADRRRALHERAGAAMESIYAESLDDHLAELAHHYSRSGNPGKGVDYGVRACHHCTDRGSYFEAVACFEASLELLNKLPDDDRRAEMELDLRTAAQRAFAANRGQGSPEALQSSERALELAQRPGVNWKRSFAALYGIFAVQLFRDVPRVCELADQLVALAEANRSTEHRVQALFALAWARIQTGDFEAAVEVADNAFALDESSAVSRSDPAVLARLANSAGLATFVLWCLGYPERASGRLSTQITLAKASGVKDAVRLGYSAGGFLHLLRGDVEQMRLSAEANLALTTELGDLTHIAQSEIFLGWTQAMAGDLRGGITRMHHHVLEYRAAGAEWAAEYFLALVAIAMGRAEQLHEALRLIDDALSIIEKSGERFFEAEVHRVKGELQFALGPSSASSAEKSLRTAIEVSRKQKAKSWELRATTSLARLLDKQGKREDARAMLAEIYDWFTEGFATADLKDAKALLDELNT